MQRLVVPAALFSLTLVACLVFQKPALAADCTVAGQKTATADEIKRAATLGITIPAENPCIDQKTKGWLDQNIDQDMQFFFSKNAAGKSRICGGRGAGLPSDFNVNDTSPKNWDRIRSKSGYVYFVSPTNAMNPGVMRCFRNFFEEMEKRGYQPCVSSALRSLAHQRASCLAPNSVVCGRAERGTDPDPSTCPKDLGAYANCPHVNGRAMDVLDGADRTSQILAYARQFKGFTQVGATSADPNHIDARGCADPNFRPSFDLKDTWTPDTRTRTPLGLGDITRSLLGVPQQPPLFPPPPPPQPIAQPQSPLGAFMQPAPLAPQAGAPAQAVQPTQKQTQTTAVASENKNVNVNTNTNTDTSLSSVADQLKELINPPTPSAKLATTVPIVITGDEKGKITSSPGQQSGQSTTSTTSIGTISTAQQTFTSGNLSTQGVNTAYLTPRETALFQALTTIRAVLYGLLEYLKPFQLRASFVPASQGHGEGE